MEQCVIQGPSDWSFHDRFKVVRVDICNFLIVRGQCEHFETIALLQFALHILVQRL